MAAASSIGLPAVLRARGGRCHDRATLRSGVAAGGRIAETCWDAAARRRVATFAHRVGERDEVVIVRRRGQRTRMADQLPPAGRGDAAGVRHT